MTTDRTFTVSQLHSALTAALRRAFPAEVWVAGEVVGKYAAPSGHTYLELVERKTPGGPPAAKLKVVCFASNLPTIRSTLRGTGVTVTDGIEIRIRGRVTHHQGQMQVAMSGIDPTYTLGRLAADRDALLRTLAAEGLLERNRLLPWPAAPLRVGLVTSVDSAAYHDFTDELSRSPYAFSVLAVDTRVQGERAPDSIAAAVTHLAHQEVRDPRWAPDVIVVVRGGGARTDLAAFDTEPVARAIAAATVPVVTGIGHEIDRSVADAVGHVALKTPTACAQHLIAAVAAAHSASEQTFASVTSAADATLTRLRVDLDADAATLARTATARLSRTSERLTAATDRVALAANATIDRRATWLATTTDRLIREAPRTLDRHTATLAVAAATVTATDPARVLARGYSITRDAAGNVVTDPATLRPGAQVRTELAAGALTATVTDVHPPTDPDPRSAP